MTEENATYHHGDAMEYNEAYCLSVAAENNTACSHCGEAKDYATYPCDSVAKDSDVYCRGGVADNNAG
jgi:hypothetical protein